MNQYKYEKNKLTKTIIHEYPLSDAALNLLSKFLREDKVYDEYIYENNLEKAKDELQFSGIIRRKTVTDNFAIVIYTYYHLSKCHKKEDLYKLLEVTNE
jgi:hypothetical protein